MKVIIVTFGVPDGGTGQHVVDGLVSIGYDVVNPRVLREDSEVALTKLLEDGDHIVGMTARQARTMQALRDNAEEDRQVNAEWERANAPIDDDPDNDSTGHI